MERIYEMDQVKEYRAISGQIKYFYNNI